MAPPRSCKVRIIYEKQSFLMFKGAKVLVECEYASVNKKSIPEGVLFLCFMGMIGSAAFVALYGAP